MPENTPGKAGIIPQGIVFTLIISNFVDDCADDVSLLWIWYRNRGGMMFCDKCAADDESCIIPDIRL